MAADYYADIEVREQDGAPWRFVAERHLGSGSLLEELILGPDESDGDTDNRPRLETTFGLPFGFHRLVELQQVLDRVRERARTERLGQNWLASHEDRLSVEILGPFAPSHEDWKCWTTLEELERYPWDSAFDRVPLGIADALYLLGMAGDGPNARLVVARSG